MLGELCEERDELAWDIAQCQSTTLAGVIAVLQYTAHDPDGERWPETVDENWTANTNEWRSTLHAKPRAGDRTHRRLGSNPQD
jgi:hypothetical protein